MSRWQLYLVLGVVLFGAGLGTGLTLSSHHASHKAQVAQAAADQAEGSSKSHAAQAAASDQQAIRNQATVADTDAHAATAKRELDRRLAALHGNAPASHLEGLPPIPTELEATQAALAQAQLVIADQAKQIATRDQLIASLTQSRDEWKASAEDAQKALALQKIASDAAVHSEARHGFLRTLEVGLVSAGAGYLAGRR